MSSYVFHYIVHGRGPLPLDMLRRDRSYPATEHSAQAASLTDYGRPCEVTLEHVGERHWMPLAERWKSFGWEVLAVQRTDSKGQRVTWAMDGRSEVTL